MLLFLFKPGYLCGGEMTCTLVLFYFHYVSLQINSVYFPLCIILG